MSDKIKQHVYIYNIEDFLKGEYIICFSISGANDWGENADGYHYVAPVEIDLSKIDLKAINKKALHIIDEKIEEVEKEYILKRELLKEKRQKFLALTHDVGAE